MEQSFFWPSYFAWFSFPCDQLKQGDNVTLEWPGIGYVEYKIINSTIVPVDYRLSIEQGNVLFLITCYPLGSTKERLIIKGEQGKHIN